MSCFLWRSSDEHDALMMTTMFVLTAIYARSHRSAVSQTKYTGHRGDAHGADAGRLRIVVAFIGRLARSTDSPAST
eukprot:8842094-Pyramimonas_sp.AAC.1